jgi:hypothetical protein
VSYLYRSSTLAFRPGSVLRRMTQRIIITYVASPFSVIQRFILRRNHMFTARRLNVTLCDLISEFLDFVLWIVRLISFGKFIQKYLSFLVLVRKWGSICNSWGSDRPSLCKSVLQGYVCVSKGLDRPVSCLRNHIHSVVSRSFKITFGWRQSWKKILIGIEVVDDIKYRSF